MSGNEPIKSITVTKDYLFNQSKVFCALPWTHVHVTPSGTAAPCCIASSCSSRTGLADATKLDLMGLVNSEGLKKLRLDMINGVKNSECESCYSHESMNISSWRQASIQRYPDVYEDVLKTNIDGSLNNFTMRYYDMRFNNICNFKCRTCGQEYSSQWEQENLKNNVGWEFELNKNSNKKLLNDVIDKIDEIEHAYFAGGEPLIMEQHYLILEEMIRRGKTNVHLTYNTNISNLKFKDKDIIQLWSHFANPVQISASIDHYGEKAEYIRHGTDWGKVESNFKQLKHYDFIQLSIHSVLSVFNYLTFDKFYEFLFNNNMHSTQQSFYSIYAMSSPSYLTCHILPDYMKEIGDTSMKKTIELLKSHEVHNSDINQFENIMPWAKEKTITYDSMSPDHQTTNIDFFKSEIERLDNIRGESFVKVFPELQQLLDL